MNASNRQKKVLRFFGVEFSERIYVGASGWNIANIMSDDNNRELWRKYLYLTKDYDIDSDQFIEHDRRKLRSLKIPEDFDTKKELSQYMVDLVMHYLGEHSPFDTPPPMLRWSIKDSSSPGSSIMERENNASTPNSERTKIVKRGQCSMTQDDVVRFLISGSDKELKVVIESSY